MPLVAYSCAAPAPAVDALKVLAKIQDTAVEFSSADAPSVKIVTDHPILGPTTVESVSWLGCARTLSQLVPSLALWEGPQVESWVDSASTTLLSVLAANDAEALSQAQAVLDYAAKVDAALTSTWLTQKFTAADVCVSLWLAMACDKCNVTDLPTKALAWITATLEAVKPFAPQPFTFACLSAAPATSSAAPSAATATAAAATTTDLPPELADNSLVQKLQEFGVTFQAYMHTACVTAEELVENVPLPSDKDTHTKNLFFKDKKHGLFLVTHATSTTMNTKQLGKLLNLEGKVNMRLADAAFLDEKLQAKPGCVGPMCIVNDSAKEIKLVLDKALFDYDYIHSHPLRNDASVKLTPAALQDYLAKAGVEPVIVEFAAGEASAPAPAPAAKAAKQPKEAKKAANPNKKKNQEGTKLALQWKKDENFAQWYSDVIVLSEMISYYDISGCYILRPWSYKVWDLMQQWFNEEILKLGVENCYFPLFVSQERLEKEKDHVEGFAPEVAWVTKSGDGELAKPIAVRPTSETIMYPAFSDWIKSHRDLPLKLNQWSNVVRWEFKFPTPFLRSREFLWQEGHTAHASYEDANVMVMQALDLYKAVYQDLLCVPVIPGYKTQKEKFAGGYQTTTVEAYIAGSGRAIQGATSHNLGQNFGKMFDIKYQDEKGETQIAWQTSWGLTTRTIGVMVMVHGDDKGLVMPPRVSPLQVVIVPVISKKFTMAEADVYCGKVLADLEANGIRAKYDNRDMYNPGWKYNHWEQKGVPVRVEVGPSDVEKSSCRLAIRHNGEKVDLPVEGLGADMVKRLAEIQTTMFEKAKAQRDEHVVSVTDWKDFVPNLEKNNLVLTPWCGPEHEDWEEWVKAKSKEESLANAGLEGEDERTSTSVAAKTLCVPFDQPELPEGTMCIASGLPATCWVLWGRSY
eukprot:Nitzschia sp. Nitz4//scaffold31_size150131//57555//60853//NITZ4_002825-RA/size150131-processed-gene-0.106-mRNA-1//1//CDS//3329547650//3050//frame0